MKRIIFKPAGPSEWETEVPPPAPGYWGLRINVVEDTMAVHAYARMWKPLPKEEVQPEIEEEEILGRLLSWFGEQGLPDMMRKIREGMKNPEGNIPKKEKILLEWVGTREWKIEDEHGNGISEFVD